MDCQAAKKLSFLEDKVNCAPYNFFVVPVLFIKKGHLKIRMSSLEIWKIDCNPTLQQQQQSKCEDVARVYVGLACDSLVRDL